MILLYSAPSGSRDANVYLEKVTEQQLERGLGI